MTVKEFMRRAPKWAEANHMHFTWKSPYFKYSSSIIKQRALPASIFTTYYGRRTLEKIERTG